MSRTLPLGRVGESVKRVDGIPKTTGEFAYSSDLVAAGMLWGHTLRSPHAHARIVELDLSEALTSPGVHAVLTHEDVPGQKRYGLEFPDQPVLALDKVRYFGEPVRCCRRASRAGAASSGADQGRIRATRARRRHGTRDGQEPIHDQRWTHGHGYLDDPRPNVVRHLVIRHGDPDTEWRRVGLGRLRARDPGPGVPRPEVRPRDPRRRGRRRHLRRDAVAARRPRPDRAVPRPRARARPHPPRGRRRRVRRARGPLDADPQRAARAAHEPAREDGLQPRGVVRRPRAPAPREDLGRAPRGSRRGARLRAHADPARRRRVRVFVDRGDVERGGVRVRSVRGRERAAESTCVYSNNPPCGAMRGFGAVQTCFAAEAQMDKLADALGVDPVELRLRNALAPGDVLPTERLEGSLPSPR